MKKSILLGMIGVFTLLAFAAGNGGKKVAIIKMQRGIASIITADGKSIPAKKGLWITEGSVVKTEPKSFVRLSFIDKSTMNVGPKSEMKIEKFSKDEAGVINVISGKIRAKVTKDYLSMDKEKSKLFVRSRSAVMGIRGTDFMFATNKKNGSSTAVLFEGSVVFNKFNGRRDLGKNLEAIVNAGNKIKPGQFSIASKNKAKATVPAKMSRVQLKRLEKNVNFDGVDAKKKVASKRSIVPPGLGGEVVSNDESSIGQGVRKIANVDTAKIDGQNQAPTTDSKGFIKGDQIKPADGSIVHIDSGAVIPLGNDSKFDKNTSEWVSNSVGTIDAKGSYIPPEGFSITNDGSMLKEVAGGKVREVILEIKPLDQVKALDNQPTIAYIPPVLATGPDGPAPASGPEGPDAGPKSGPEAGPEGPAPAGDTYLPPPPAPIGTGYIPPTGSHPAGTDGGPPPPSPTRTHLKVKVIRGN